MGRGQCRGCEHFEEIKGEDAKNVLNRSEAIGFCVRQPPRTAGNGSTAEGLEEAKRSGKVWPRVRGNWKCGEFAEDTVHRMPTAARPILDGGKE